MILAALEGNTVSSNCEHKYCTNSTQESNYKTHCISCGALVHDDNWWRGPYQRGSAQ